MNGIGGLGMKKAQSCGRYSLTETTTVELLSFVAVSFLA